jgi:hypothetical protein
VTSLREGRVCVKGPYERLKYDLRRVWACPLCQHRERTGGDCTSRLCPCQAKVEPAERRYMTLVDDGCRRLIAREPMEFSEDWYLPPEPVAYLDEEPTDESAGAQVDSRSITSDASPTEHAMSAERGPDETGPDETGTDETGTDETGTDPVAGQEAAAHAAPCDEIGPGKAQADVKAAGAAANFDTVVGTSAPAHVGDEPTASSVGKSPGEPSAMVQQTNPDVADSLSEANVGAGDDVGDATGDTGQGAGRSAGDLAAGDSAGTPETKPAAPRSRGREKRRGRGRTSGRGRRGKSSGGGGGSPSKS